MLEVLIPEVLKVALRFEALIAEKRALDEYKDYNDREVLHSIYTKYNQFKSTAALKRWQLSPEFVNAVAGIILGVCPLARQEIRRHLDHNKWEESGRLACPC